MFSLKIKYLRIIASMNNKKIHDGLERLTEEQRYVYDIAIKLLSSPKSILEINPKSGIMYIKNDLKLIKIDSASIHFINGKYSYSFNYDYFLMKELRTIFYRHKEISIKNMIDEISEETTEHLRTIYFNLTNNIDY